MTQVQPLTPDDPRQLGAYEMLGRLGEGGQGIVYLGRGPTGDRVAVKLLHAGLTADPGARARFLREVAVAQRVARFCTAPVLHADLAGNQPYIVSEYVPGPSLRQLVDREGPRRGGALDRLAIATATALAAIHRAGILHRDFKPANVLMGPEGPVVIDFGIARALDTPGATATGMTMGTPSYLAPEQLTTGDVSPAADVFAWGVTMVFAASGTPAFGQDSIPVVMNRILHQEPDLGALDGPMRDLVAACLSKDPALRPTAEELIAHLTGAPTGPLRTPAPQGTPPETAHQHIAHPHPPAAHPSSAAPHGATPPSQPAAAAGPPHGAHPTPQGPPPQPGTPPQGPTPQAPHQQGSPFHGAPHQGPHEQGSPLQRPQPPHGPQNHQHGPQNREPQPQPHSGPHGPQNRGPHGRPEPQQAARRPPHAHPPGRQGAGGPGGFIGGVSKRTALIVAGAVAGTLVLGAGSVVLAKTGNLLPGPTSTPTSEYVAAEQTEVAPPPVEPPPSSWQPTPTPSATRTKTRKPRAEVQVPSELPTRSSEPRPSRTTAEPSPTRTRQPTRKPTTQAPQPEPTPTPTRKPTTSAPSPTRTTAAPKPNPYSPTGVCGSGYKVIDSHGLGGATIYLLYSSAAGKNCVVTMSRYVVPGRIRMSATLQVQNGGSGGDTGSYTAYAGPVRVSAVKKCVIWGGSYGSASWKSGWSHCA